MNKVATTIPKNARIVFNSRSAQSDNNKENIERNVDQLFVPCWEGSEEFCILKSGTMGSRFRMAFASVENFGKKKDKQTKQAGPKSMSWLNQLHNSQRVNVCCIYLPLR